MPNKKVAFYFARLGFCRIHFSGWLCRPGRSQ